MKNPCTRTCPDRTPGCNCEKRKAWRFALEQEKKDRERRDIVYAYQRESRRRRLAATYHSFKKN